MLLSEKEVAKRLNSPDNLMNRLRQSSVTNRTASTTRAMELFGIGNRNSASQETTQVTPPQLIQPNIEVPLPTSSQPSVDDLVLNADSKLKIELAHTAALDTLVSSVNRLKDTIPALESPVKLSQIAMNMSRIMTSLVDKKKDERDDDKQVHYHFYMPEQAKVSDYPVIEVNADSIV